MLTKWFHLTRLETRTKESNMYASILEMKLECKRKLNSGNPSLDAPLAGLS